MPLRRLAALERKKIETEYKEVLQRIKYLEDLLKSPKKILGVIKEELTGLKAKYDTPRRTMIVDQAPNGKPITAGELVPDETVVIAVSQGGRVCRWPVEEGLEPVRGKQDDPLVAAVPAHTRDTLYLFTTAGRALIVPVHQIPSGSAPSEGPSLSEFVSGSIQPVVAGLALPSVETPGAWPYLCLVSRQGRVKRVALDDLTAVRGSEAVVMGMDRGDTLLTAFATPGEGELILVSAQGQAIRFAEEEVRPMGLPAAGVLGMKLSAKDEVVGAGLVKARGDLVVVTQAGMGKRTALSEFPKQGRNGQGVTDGKLEDKEVVATAATVNVSDRVMLISQKETVRQFRQISAQVGPVAKGQELIAIRGGIS
jgi:DNA gyrase subunit A